MLHPSNVELACALAGCKPDEILVLRVDSTNGALVVVVDRGVAGCPKYVYSVAALRAADDQFVSPKEQDADGTAFVDTARFVDPARFEVITHKRRKK